MVELKIVCCKTRTCFYYDDIIKIEDFHFDAILLDEKSYGNILICDISYKSLIGAKIGLSEFMMEQNI